MTSDGGASPGAIPLPPPELFPDVPVNFLELVEVRSSVRQYSSSPVSKRELSYLLWCTQGVKSKDCDGKTKRTVPSAGGLHVFTTYVYANNVGGIEAGLYRFLAEEHGLCLVCAKEGDDGFGEAFAASFSNPALVKNGAVTFVWAADADRSIARFGENAERYMYLDAGHVCQNLYLSALSVNIGVCAVGAFSEEKLFENIRFAERKAAEKAGAFLPPKVSRPVYAATAGKLS